MALAKECLIELAERQRLPCNISILNDYMRIRDRRFSYKSCGFSTFTMFCKWFQREGWLVMDQERSSVVISRTKFDRSTGTGAAAPSRRRTSRSRSRSRKRKREQKQRRREQRLRSSRDLRNRDRERSGVGDVKGATNGEGGGNGADGGKGDRSRSRSRSHSRSRSLSRSKRRSGSPPAPRRMSRDVPRESERWQLDPTAQSARDERWKMVADQA
ncbi:hypothetical protein Vretifemale_12260 [Volvox reticuliferus]|nr:hypothetical protein Vretifemale_12260 [Volvox reticuliferus]